MSQLHAFLTDEQGATAIEYALIAGLVSIGVIAGIIAFDDSFDAIMARVSNAITNL